MKNIAIHLACSGIGDIISSIPTIKYLHNLYKKKILVFTHNTDLLKNYHYITEKEIDKDEIKKINNDKNWILLNTFDTSKDLHPRIDIRQFHTNKLGFQLLPDEMNIKFYPDKYEPIKNLPENYVVIHPVKTWPSRTWEQYRWQNLINTLNDYNIPVIAVGKNSSEHGTYNTQKPTFNVDIKLGLNLLNKISIHQTWHILNKAVVVVTMDSGILHLAGTTDTAIIQLGSSINPKFRAPYRNNRQNYKYSYISGECKLMCASNLNYFMKYNTQFNIMPPLPFCLERSETIGDQSIDPNKYKCHPSICDVSDETIRFYNLYKKENKKTKIKTGNKGVI